MLMFSFLQYSLIVDRALAEINDDTQRVNLFEHLFKLCDVILNGFTAQLQSIKAVYGEVERYESIRSKYAACRKQLLSAFGKHSLSSFYHSPTCGVKSNSFWCFFAVEHEHFDRAASLAEKFCDFETLVTICENSNNMDRLQRYMEQFKGMVSGKKYKKNITTIIKNLSKNSAFLQYFLGIRRVRLPLVRSARQTRQVDVVIACVTSTTEQLLTAWRQQVHELDSRHSKRQLLSC